MRDTRRAATRNAQGFVRADCIGVPPLRRRVPGGAGRAVVWATFALGSALLGAALLGAVTALPAQQAAHSLGGINFGNADHSAHTPAEHAVEGVVHDAEGKAVPGAVVYLKSSRSKAMNLVVADEKGAYRFSPLAADTDYELWAQVGDVKGPVRPISAFSTGPITMQLRVK